MIQAILGALAALPRIADALTGIAAGLSLGGQQMKEAHAKKRQGEKDEEVDDAIARALSGDGVRDEEDEQREPLDF